VPDWVVHLAVAWSVCRILSFRYPQFNPANTVLVMVGSIFPDAIKISILTELVGYDVWDYIYVFHLPVGTFILAGIAALLFREKKSAFLFLSMGIITHYLLDLLLIQVGYGMALFYPLSWTRFTLNLVPNDDYYITIMALFIALIVYLVSRLVEKRKFNQENTL